MQQAGSQHAEHALVHLQYADDPTPEYLQRAAASNSGVGVTHVHLASVSPVAVSRIEPASGMVVQRSELIPTAVGATAGVRLLWRPADPALSASLALPRPSPSPPQQLLAASIASSSSGSDAAHRSEIIRSLLFDAQQDREEHSPAAAAAVAVTAAPSYINASTSLLQTGPTELPDLASLSSMHGSSFVPQPNPLPAQALALPVLDELPSIRALVSDASVLPDELPSEQPLPPAEPSPSPPSATAAEAPVSTAASDPSPEPPPVLLPMPAEWSPSDPATTGTPSSPPIALAAPPAQHKSPAEEKQPEPEDRPAVDARPVPAALHRFQTPPLPSSAPITRAFTASAGASPYRGALNSLFKSSSSAAAAAAPNQLSSLIISRRGSTGRPTSRSSHRAPGSAEAISPSRGNLFQMPPSSVSMLRQRSQLSSQQAAAAGITPFRTALGHARSTGSSSSLPSSASNPPSAVASPTGLGVGRFLPASATAGSVNHPFLDSAVSAVRLSDAADAATHLALVKAQLDEHVEMRLREVRREMEEMVATQMTHYASLIAASAAAAATNASATGSTRISPFHAPPTPLSATAAASASGVHPFMDAPRPSQQPSLMLSSPRPSPSPARHTTPGPSFGSGALAMPRPTSSGPSRLLLSPRPATAGLNASSTGLQPARSPRPQSFLFGAATTGAV